MPGTSSDPDRPRHSIRVVAERTGLTPDVLRVWERRYGAVTPARSAAGQRVYSDQELERLRLLQRAISVGRSIGSIASLSTKDLEELVQEDDEAKPPHSTVYSPSSYGAETEVAISLIRTLDGAGLEAHLRRKLAGVGVSAFVDGMVGPLLLRVGDEWHVGRMTIAQEHLASSVVKQVLATIIGSPMHAEGAPGMLVATPAGDHHELGALLAAATATAEGWRVVNLGPDLPAAEIAAAAVQTRVALVALSLVYAPDAREAIRELQELRVSLPNEIPLLLGGAAALRMKDRIRMDGIQVVGSFAELRGALKRRTGGLDPVSR
jgi:MerR family transcriptional regulator, light-induced transcriptional regulator